MEHQTSFSLTGVALAYLMGRDPTADLGGNATGFYFECEGTCDRERLAQAIQKVIVHQPMLRTVIFPNGTQAELTEIPVYHMPVIDLSHSSEEEIEAFFRKLREEQSHEIFPVGQWPMFRISFYQLPQNRSRVVFSFDMMLVDRFSIEILVKELHDCYENPELTPEPLLHDYRQYVELLAEERSRKLEQDRAFWERQIPEMPLAPAIALEAGEHSGGRFDTKVKRYSAEFYQKLQDVLYENRILPSVYLLYCYGKCLCRFSGTDALSVSMTVSERSPMQHVFSDVIGDFTKLLLVDLESGGTQPWTEVCRKLQKKIRTYLKHTAFDGLDVMKEIARREQLGGKAAFPFAFTSRLTAGDESYWDFLGEMVYRISRTPQLAVDCQISEHCGELEVRWDYLTGVLPESFVQNMFLYFLDTIEGTWENRPASAGIPVQEVEAYNATETEIPVTTLQNLIAAQVERTPNRIALTAGEKRYTYRELWDTAGAIAGTLRRKYGSGRCIMVDGKRCGETILLMLGILRSGNAYVPFDLAYPQKRIDAIRESCDAAAILTADMVQTLTAENPDGAMPLLGNPEDVVYIIFTSGSTGVPKGVVITQDAVCNTIQDINSRFGVTEEDCIIGISAFWFDLSVYDIFGAFSTGAHLVLCERVDIDTIADLMHRYPVSFWNTVPAIMELLADSGESFAGSPLRNVLLSGDWIPLELPRKIQNCFPAAKVCSLGGATEASIWSIYYPINEVQPAWNSIPYGYPLANQTIYVLNAAGEICPVGVQGEICIGGRGVAKEYCASPKETEAHYFQHPQFGRLYRTGDYGKFAEAGYVIFCGRIDQQVKLHGFRIELGEIESALLKTEAVEKALAVITRSESGASFLTAYVVPKEGVPYSEEALFHSIAERVPEYMVPSFLVQLDAFPLTPNGKVDRKALPVPALEESGYEAPQTELEQAVAEIWQQELSEEAVGRSDNFFYLGGDSMTGLRVTSQIQQKLGISVEIAELFNAPVLQAFCQTLADKQTAHQEELPQIQPEPELENEPFPLTAVQRSYWMGAQGMLKMSGVTTHAFCEVQCENLDISRAEQAFNYVIAQQGMMRAVVRGDGMQVILSEVPYYTFAVQQTDSAAFEDACTALRQEMEHERFQPDRWPLFRVAAVTSGTQTRLFLDLDNLIFDGFSVQLLFREWNAFYEDPQKSVEKRHLSFRDYVQALYALQETKRYAEDKTYWQEQIAKMHPAPELFTETSPDTLETQSILHIQKALEPAVWQKLQENCRNNGLTLSSVLLTAYAQMLALWSRRPAFTVNLTQYNRLFSHPEIQELVGDFTLLSMMSMEVRGSESFAQAAQRIQTDLASHMSHPYYGGVEVQRDYARANQREGVIFPVVFTVTVGMTAGKTERMFGNVARISTETPQVWLDCQVTELNGGLYVSFEAVQELFREQTVREMAEFYRSLLLHLAESSEVWNVNMTEVLYRNAMIPTLPQREKLSAIPPVDGGMTLERLFVEQVKRNPNAIAVADAEREITYGQLFYEAYQLSRAVQQSGQKIAAVLLKKSWRQVTAVLGILMAGAAYLPLDVSNPDMRITEILQKAETDLLLTEQELADRAAGLSVRPIFVEAQAPAAELPVYTPVCQPDDLAYIIFTSGSIGTPKGVMISHRGAVNTILDVSQRFGIGSTDRTIAVSALNFDLSVYDIFGMLSCGGAVVVPSEADRKDPKRLAELVRAQHVTVWNSVPAFMQLFAENVALETDAASLRVVMMSGDWIPLALPEKLLAALPNTAVYSLGGATEASIWSNYYPVTKVEPSWRSIPYGYPLSGQGFRILNENMQDCPPNVIGKLYITGTGVAMGYLHDPVLTAERFLTDQRTGQRLYDTGDLGMYWEDGTMEFFGREDFQVKIRGHRIELGEIEAALLHSGLLREACAFTIAHNGRTHLAAAVVAENPAGDDMTEALLESARERLPGYMMPSVLFQVDSLPLTANSKIDRKALVAQGVETLKQHNGTAETVLSAVEQQIAAIWQSVLNTQEIPEVDEDFFDFGGDSLDIVKVRTMLSDLAGREIEITELFTDPTVSGMAALVQEEASES